MRGYLLRVGFLILMGSSALALSYDLEIHLSNQETVLIPLDDILRLEFSEESADVHDSTGVGAAVRAFLLMQNFPNPATPSTTIEYEIPAAGEVAVRVFDVRGGLVRELLNETQEGGRHRVTWDGSNGNRVRVASGLYFYTVATDGQTLTRRLIVVR